MNIDNESAPPKDKLRRYATWGVVAGTAVWTTFFFGFLVIGALFPKIIPESWFCKWSASTLRARWASPWAQFRRFQSLPFWTFLLATQSR